MSGRRIVYVACDVGKAAACAIGSGDLDGAMDCETLADARHVAKAAGWAKLAGNLDACPACVAAVKGATLAAVKKAARKLNVDVDDSAGDILYLDAPARHCFAVNGLHVIAHAGDKVDRYADALADLAQGVERCPADCGDCADQRRVEAER